MRHIEKEPENIPRVNNDFKLKLVLDPCVYRKSGRSQSSEAENDKAFKDNALKNEAMTAS